MENVKVNVADGSYTGFIGAEGIAEFRGIQYASVERFQAPVLVEPKGGENVDAFEYGPAPIQAIEPGTEQYFSQGIDEQCLNLNLFVKPDGKTKKPVMVWVYGGAQIKGTNVRGVSVISKPGQPLKLRIRDYAGNQLVAENEDIILISVNYRVGFLGTADLSCLEGYSEKYAYSNNGGRLDLTAALQWIHNNIAYFGGDPENVTLFGQSAGANNITCLMLMDEPRKLFQKAILESSFAADISVTRLEDSKTVSKAFFEDLGVKTIDELMAKSAAEILAVQNNIGKRSTNGSSAFESIESKFFSPVVDGVVIPFDYYEQLLAGSCKHMACIIGTNQGEYDQQFAPFFEQGDTEKAVKFTVAQNWGKLDAKRGTNPEVVEKYLAQYADSRDRFTAAKDMKNDLYLRMGGVLYALAQSQYVDTYMYYQTTNFNPASVSERCAHGTEIDIVFNHNTTVPEDIQKATRGAWVAFARTGNPNNAALGCEWTRFTAQHRETMILGPERKMVNGVRNEDTNLLLPLFKEYKENEKLQQLVAECKD